jgi:uncharacterized protein YjiS (DUF1127 family)
MHFPHDWSALAWLLRRTIETILLGTEFAGAAPAPRRVTPMLVSILNFLQSWKRYNKSLRELSRLGDRELADIGISRSDIPRIAWDAANHG